MNVIPIKDSPLEGLGVVSAIACSTSRPMTRELAYALAQTAADRLEKIEYLRKELPTISPRYTN